MACFEAAAAGDLDLLKQLRESGYSWDEWTCAGAARNGHLETLQWVRKNGCPWNRGTCVGAARAGHLETLQWAIENGCAHKYVEIDKQGCVEKGVFPGHGCLVSGCQDARTCEGLCNTHSTLVTSELLTFVCHDVAELILRIVCAH